MPGCSDSGGSGGVTEASSGADLVAGIVSFTPSLPHSQDTLYLASTIRNEGTRMAGSFAWRFTADGAVLQAGTLSSLQVGQTVSVQAVVFDPLALGLHQVQLEVDYLDQIVEVDERNNISEAALTILDPAIVEVGLAHAPGNPAFFIGGSPRISGMVLGRIEERHTIVSTVGTGTHSISLEDVTPSCSMNGQNPRSVTAPAGTVTQVIFQISCVFEPAERIVYQVERQEGTGFFGDIFTVRPDGSKPRRLTTDGMANYVPAWSRDGTRIALDHQGRVHLMNFDGSELRPLEVPRPPAQSTYGTWSPDGKHVAFSSLRSGAWDIWVATVDGSALTNLTADAEEDRQPRWSSDGTHIAFVKDGDVHVMNADGTGVVRLTTGIAPRWSPDASRLVFLTLGTGRCQIWTIARDGSDLTLVSDHTPDCGAPVYSPDGQNILFHSPRLGLAMRLWIMDATGGNRRIFSAVPDSGAAHPSWWRPPG